jgi:hypothetical protein
MRSRPSIDDGQVVCSETATQHVTRFDSKEKLMSAKNPRAMFQVAFGVVLMFVASSAPATAQSSDWTVGLGAGTSPTVGDISSRLTRGWNVDLRASRELNDRVGLFADFTLHQLGVANQVLQTLQVPDGNARMASLTLGPTWRFPVANMVDGYVLGGVGWYRRTVEFTQPTLGLVDIIDPWWGYVGSAVVPANQILGSVTSDAFGGNFGGGVSVKLGDSGAAAFAELRYHYANTKPMSTSVVPVSFGIRWAGR